MQNIKCKKDDPDQYFMQYVNFIRLTSKLFISFKYKKELLVFYSFNLADLIKFDARFAQISFIPDI